MSVVIQYLYIAGIALLIQGHARIDPTKTLKPRSTADNLKSGPCGQVPASYDPADRTVLVAGQPLTVEWEETINHPGWYRIAFSPDGVTGYDSNVLADNITDTQNGPVSRNDPATYHRFTSTVTVPDIECDYCSIQLIQVMTDRNPPTNYYSCSDVRIVKQDAADLPPMQPRSLQVVEEGAP